MASHGNHLCVVHQHGVTVDEETFTTHLTATEFSIHLDSPITTVSTHDLALSARSTLTWMGYSRQGVLCIGDSKGVVRRVAGGLWTPILDERAECKAMGDHLWVIEVNDVMGHVRCLFVKVSY